MSEVEISPSWSENTKEYQRVRRARLASRGERFYDGIDEDIEFKKCSHCKRTLTLSRFQRDVHRLSGYTVWCLDCRVEWQFLYKRKKEQVGYLYGTGICMICSEIHPFMLENHHIFGVKVSDTVVSMCGNCHNLLKYVPLTLWSQSTFWGRNVNG